MAADVFAFLELEGIEGEAQDSDYQGKIELQSFSWGASNNSSFAVGTGASVGKGQIHDISISMYMSRASLRLMERAVNGLHVNTGKISLLKLSGDKKIPYFEIDMDHVVVTSHNISAHGGGQLPMELSYSPLREGEDEVPAARQRGRRAGKCRFRMGPAKERLRVTEALEDEWMMSHPLVLG